MGDIVLKCSKCGRFYMGGENKDINCIDNYKNCGGIMCDTGLKFDEANIIRKISSDNELLNAMIELKKNDIIEYNLKLSQFRNQVNQQKQQQENNVPKCPTCQSINIKKISTTSKVTSVAMFGLLSQKVKKTYHCNKCGYEW